MLVEKLNTAKKNNKNSILFTLLQPEVQLLNIKRNTILQKYENIKHKQNHTVYLISR